MFRQSLGLATKAWPHGNGRFATKLRADGASSHWGEQTLGKETLSQNSQRTRCSTRTRGNRGSKRARSLPEEEEAEEYLAAFYAKQEKLIAKCEAGEATDDEIQWLINGGILVPVDTASETT
jgi:hypothetical protein